MANFDEMELLWIQKVLNKHGFYLATLLTEKILDKQMVRTGHLLNSIHYKTAFYGENPVLQMSFMSYGRAAEIHNNVSKNTRKFQQAKINRIRAKNPGDKVKIDTAWYARTAYGSLNRMIGIMMYEFTNREREHLKSFLESQLNS